MTEKYNTVQTFDSFNKDNIKLQILTKKSKEEI